MRRTTSWAVGRTLLAVLVSLAGAVASGQCLTQTDLRVWKWSPVQSAPVSGGEGQAVVGAGGLVYLLRCQDGKSPEFYRYDPATDRWSPASTTGLSSLDFRSGTALAWDGDKTIYALAGASYRDTGRTEFWCYNMEAERWEPLPRTPYAQGAGNALTWSQYDNRLYAFVGSAHTNHNKGKSFFIRYDPSARTWTTLPIGWTATEDGASLAAVGEYIYALQGEVCETIPERNRGFARFHIPSQSWEELREIPDPGGVGDGGSLLWVGLWCPELADYIIALGGGAADETSGSGVYLYTISTNTWTSLDSLPCPVRYYVGNRLAFANRWIVFWQGSPKTTECEGRGFYRLEW